MRVPLGIKPIVDFAFKRIFGTPENVPILVGLLNAILQLADPIEDVEILNPFSYQEFEEDKLIVLDIRARDTMGRWLDIEMQVSVFPGLLQRLTYYACAMYVDQLAAGQDYAALRPAISICLLSQVLFSQVPFPHHRFRLVDPEHGRELPGAIEVHTVELSKYNLDEETIGEATPIEQWSFFFLRADRYEAARLRELLRGAEFQGAIATAETIAAKTKDRRMYDQREKAQRDHLWALNSVREEGRELGREEGREEGRVEGREEGRIEGRGEGLREGREQGLELGALVGNIQLLQQLLGETPLSTANLSEQPADQLSTLLGDLQQRLRSRENR
jgi:predicted transposase/invertase (TIGR01784 family)